MVSVGSGGMTSLPWFVDDAFGLWATGALTRPVDMLPALPPARGAEGLGAIGAAGMSAGLVAAPAPVVAGVKGPG